ncbi:MAG: hypothetical protein QOD66_739 [Solirubrobacteraceae bacterium]|jgi:hypothetical protein|nr:hypothetical protein [Solirubrobacteraceae bacterium]
MTVLAHTHTYTSDVVTSAAPVTRLPRTAATAQVPNTHALAARCVR